MDITLRIKGKDKTFVADFINARCFRNLLKLNQEIDYDNLTDADLDKMVDLMVQVYGKQFTRDELYDGLRSNSLINEWLKVAGGIMNEFSDSVGEDNNEKN
jgi:hypothetical protein